VRILPYRFRSHRTLVVALVTDQRLSLPRIAQRDANRLKWQEKKAAEKGEKTGDIQERQKALREKDRVTMDAFMKMAKERFG
jgi:ornithine carbamoyltransferase